MSCPRSEGEKLYISHYLTGSGGVYVESKPFIRGGSKFTDVLGRIGRAALPIMKTAGSYIGKRALNLLADTGSDILSGKNVGESFQKNAKAAAENIRFDLAQKINSRKRKKTVKKPPRKKQRVRGGNLW